MDIQYFKGDANEIKVTEAVKPAFAQTSLSLDDFLAGAYDASPFLLMLYDEQRVPFSERINKTAFVEFIKETLRRFPFIGTFDTYLFILRAIFGTDSEITFEVPSPGILNVSVNATSTLEFEWQYRDADGTWGGVLDMAGNQIIFRGIAGIETEYELELLFSEIIPAGITPHVALTFFERHNFIAEDGGTFDVVDHLENQIIFIEVG